MTDGLPNPNAGSRSTTCRTPRMQRAFDNFWANKPGPDGVPLQQHYAEAMRAVAARFVASPNVIGYEAMNEPWPGTNWQRAPPGVPISSAAARAVLRTDDRGRAIGGPSPSRLRRAVRALQLREHRHRRCPGAGSPNVLSTHVYALEHRGQRVGHGPQRRRGGA